MKGAALRLLPGTKRLTDLREMQQWRARGFAAPSPAFIKRAVLLRNGWDGGTWVESGTFLGETSLFLARRAPRVFTIEPSERLHREAVKRFAGVTNLTAIQGLSEAVLPQLLQKLEGDVNFWLDGHYSAGMTHRGPKETPIVEELAAVAASRSRLRRVAVLVDDVRCFSASTAAGSGYPSIDELVDWARQAGLEWHIEHDIFVARSPSD